MIACLAFSGNSAAEEVAGRPPTLKGLKQAMGVNTHFIAPPPGALAQVARSGNGWIRNDIFWQAIEKTRGVYDFTASDSLLDAARNAGLRVLAILDYGNPLYDEGGPPRSREAIAAYATWAESVISRYKGRGILWEIWNEPNGPGFWPPRQNADEYMALLARTAALVRATMPGEILVGPAVAGMDFPFVERCLQLGMLRNVAAISVHPYSEKPPELFPISLARMKALVRQYNPDTLYRPIIVTEWGYSSFDQGVSEARQASYLSRLRLVCIANEVPLTIWYDWMNDGADPSEREFNFGMIRHSSLGLAETSDQKPAYHAQVQMGKFLNGTTFIRRYATGDTLDHVYIFKAGTETRIAAWTLSPATKAVRLPLSKGVYSVFTHLGERRADFRVPSNPLSFSLVNESTGKLVAASSSPGKSAFTLGPDPLFLSGPFSP